VGIIVAVFLRRPPSQGQPKTQVSKISVRVSRDNAKAFVEAYEARSKTSEEMKSLLEKAQKGKIQRRQYKVQRRALELRCDTLSKQINDLKATFRDTGGNMANLVKQLDVAETELSKIQASIQRTEVRRRTGELPLEQYKQVLDELRLKSERAESTVHGILLRIREETR
jgi:chromosome segregation ATPase